MSALDWALDELSLVADKSVTGEAFWFETVVDGWSLGAPESVKVVFASLAADGDDEQTTRHGNRQVTFQVKVCGSDLGAVAAGERALRLVLNRAPGVELRFTPPDGLGEISVFDVLSADMSMVPDDLAMVQSPPWVTYSVTLTCKPWVRPTEPVTVSLTYGTDTGTSLDAGTSTTGWSASQGSVSAVTYLGESAIKASGSGSDIRFTRTAVALTSAKPYLAVEVASAVTTGFFDSLSAKLNGVSIGAPVATIPQASGYTRYLFPHSAAGTTKDVEIAFRFTWTPPNQAVFDAYVGGLYAYSTAPGSGLLIADVEGSERAPMTVNLARVSNAALGAFVISQDPTYLTYGWNPGDQATWPNAPAGSYMVLLPSAGQSNHFSTLTINGQTSSTRGAVGTYRWYSFNLGARRDGRLGTITTGWADEVSGVGSTETAPTTLYLLRVDKGSRLGQTAHQVGSFTGRYGFSDSPTVETPRVGLWSGAAADGSDAVAMVSTADPLEPLVIKPPRFALWIKGIGAVPTTDFTATAWYYPNSHTLVPRKGLTSS